MQKTGGVSCFFKILDKSLPVDEIIIHEPIDINRVNEIMLASKCVLDTDRETQTGTTPRLIWALALGKKVITTNKNVRRMPFYNPQYISIIDRENPQLDWNFIEADLPHVINPEIEKLRIDLWVKNFIE